MPHLYWICCFLLFGRGAEGFSAVAKRKGTIKKHQSNSSSLPFLLQKCTTPAQVLETVASPLSPSTDPLGTVASLTLIRLCKQLMSLQNEYLYPMSSCEPPSSTIPWKDHTQKSILRTEDSAVLHKTIQTLAQANTSTENMVEGTKSAAVLARLLPDIVTIETCQPLFQHWESQRENLAPHQLSGLQWAYACFQSTRNDQNLKLPDNLQQQYDNCNLPFCFLPGYLSSQPDLTVANLVSQVPFQIDAIQTTSTQQVVAERRETAWLGDEGVAPFRYSGKSMPRCPWSPLVQTIRDAVANSPDHPYYYDGCLLNHYPDGGSAMRYHIDPDQGTLWDFPTAVVSVGASRRVAFRPISSNQPQSPHNFVVMHGDVMLMVEDCQSRFQHAVKPADNKLERAARASLVFKKSMVVTEKRDV